jgi:kynurenine formamidase
MISDAIYLSYFIDEQTPVYGGTKDTIKIKRLRSIDSGDNSNNLELRFPGHIGTHIDFPYHFSNAGKKLEDYPASFWIFHKVGFINCDIAEVKSSIKVLPSDIECLILKTGFSVHRGADVYWAAQPVIPAIFADHFKEKFPKLRVFGFDLISLTSKLDRAEGKKAHLQFLIQNDILILEDMNLQQINTAPSKLIISPLQIKSADGVPCNVIAFM